MKNFKLTIQYDGTRYNGWQKQGNTSNTLQEKFENILYEIFKVETQIYASGRTDAGVHAIGQIANFKVETELSTKDIMMEINKLLPYDVNVVNLENVEMRFHSRLNAKSKEYMYKINTSKNVFEKNYAFNCFENIDIDEIKKATELFIGEHDFRGFCSNKRYKKSTIRKIFSIDVYCRKDGFDIIYRGNGFLYNMVRIMTGTLIEIGEGKRKTQTILDIFETKNREIAGFTAPPYGLYLMKVFY